MDGLFFVPRCLKLVRQNFAHRPKIRNATFGPKNKNSRLVMDFPFLKPAGKSGPDVAYNLINFLGNTLSQAV